MLSVFGDLFKLLFEQPIFNILMAIYGVFHSFWFAIVVMTLLVRTAMIPLVFRQLQSSKVMQELSPKIQQIQREFRQEPMVMQQKLNALYKENHYSPYASCLPLLVQMPFLYGLFGAFNTILRDPHVTALKLNKDLYPFVRGIFGPSGLTHLPDMHFLWANLAIPDFTHILPVLAAILTFMQIRMSLKKPQLGAAAKPKTGAPDPNAASMKMMQFLMPAFTLFIGWTFPSGLALYWIVTTGYSVVQQYFFNGRNWGGLLDGIPGLSAPAPALAGTAGIVDSTISPTRSSRRNVTVTEEKPMTVANRARALPSAVVDDAEDTEDEDISAPQKNPAPKGPTTRPIAPKTTAPVSKTPSTPLRTTTNGKKESVRLVSTPNANGNGNKPATAVVTRPPRTSVTTPRITTKPKTTKGSSKKGR